MNWDKKYRDITEGWLKCADDISADYPDCDSFEKCILALRLKGWTYADIQKKLGMPPKKLISQVLKKWNPEIIDNASSKTSKVGLIESEIYNLVRKQENGIFKVLFEDDDYEFYIKDKTLYFKDCLAPDNLFSELNEFMQNQIWREIKENVNE